MVHYDIWRKTMQKIYICDDNKIQLIKIKNIIQEEILKHEYNMKIEKCYTSSEELLFDTVESKEPNIYFLDVCMENENSGFKTAIEVRNKQLNAFIIFITSHYEFVYNVFSYHIEPLDYIVKEINEENIKKKIENCLITIDMRCNKDGKGYNKFSLKIGRSNITEDFEKIISFEKVSDSNRVIMTTKNSKMEFYGSISDIINNLNEDFCRCKRNYIVNKNYIDYIDKKNKLIYMKNNTVFSYSNRLMKGMM